jgi:hypothetical protein
MGRIENKVWYQAREIGTSGDSDVRLVTRRALISVSLRRQQVYRTRDKNHARRRLEEMMSVLRTKLHFQLILRGPRDNFLSALRPTSGVPG